MTSTFVVRELFDALKEDRYRKTNPLSPEVERVQRVLFHPFADEGDWEEAMGSWFQRHQPCLFGRVAAATGTLHYQFITERDLLESDQHIAAKIHEGLKRWRGRSVAPHKAVSTPAHGFILVIASPRIALAEPDETMHRLSLEVLRLWGCRRTLEAHGNLFWEDLYLQNPSDKSYVRFSFTVDFFATAGDGRWWHDHRIPGGLGFTANSVGHMRRFREWYEGRTDQKEWSLATAMETIATAFDTPYGRATWLKDLANGQPLVSDVSCPFASTRRSLIDKDWTRYGGHLHTDHSVRKEFFRPEPEKSLGLQREEWLEDFQYLYDPTSPDHAQFMAGISASEEEVLTVVGAPRSYVKITGPRRRRPSAGISDTEVEGYKELDALVSSCQAWHLNESELASLQSALAS
jgi:hypothetical protein